MKPKAVMLSVFVTFLVIFLVIGAFYGLALVLSAYALGGLEAGISLSVVIVPILLLGTLVARKVLAKAPRGMERIMAVLLRANGAATVL